MVAVAGAAPTRLRADGSDWLSFPRFALPHMARPLFTWAPGSQTAFALELSDAAGHLVWASGKQLSTEPSVRYPPSAPALQSGTYHWRVATYSDPSSEPSPFASAALHVAIPPADWSMAAWLGGDAVNVYTASFQTGPKSTLASVVLYVCGLGYSSVRFNGQDLNVLTTAPWTNNAIVNGFSSLDLTPWLADGGDANHVIVSLGYGWRDTNVFAVRDADSKDPPCLACKRSSRRHGSPQVRDDDSKDRVGAVARMLRAKVIATFNNGSTSVLTYTGDGTWQAAAGPSTADSVYNGESYDARIAAELFDSDGRAAARSSSRWVPAPRVDGPAGLMVPWSVPPVEVLETAPHTCGPLTIASDSMLMASLVACRCSRRCPRWR